MATIVGLDIGTKTVTGAIVSGTPKKFRLVDFFVEEIPEISWESDGVPKSEEVDLSDDDFGGIPVGVGEVIRRALT